MADCLDRLLKNYIEMVAPNEKDKDLVAPALRKQIIDEIRPKIEKEIYDSTKEKIEKEMEEKRTLDQAQHLKNLMLEGILLAFIVGMIVNQFTDVVSAIKPEQLTRIWWLITLGIPCALILLIVFYVGIRLYNSMIEIMKNLHNTN